MVKLKNAVHQINKLKYQLTRSLRMGIRSVWERARFEDFTVSPSHQYDINLLTLIVIGNLVTAILLFAYILVFSERPLVQRLIITLPGIILQLWALYRIRKGEIQLVKRVIIGIGWLFLTIAAYGSNGIYSSTMLGFMVLLILGALLLDSRWRIILLIATISYFILLYGIEVTGNLPEAPFKDLPFRIFILTSTALSIFIIVAYHVYAIRRSEQLVSHLKISAERTQLRRRLTQDLVHDLRTPLATLKTSAYLARRQQEKGMPVTDSVAKIEMQADKLNVMIEELFQLLLLDEINANQILSEVSKIDLETLIQSIFEAEKSLADTKNISLTLTSDIASKTYVCGNRGQLQRAFANLIENAIHYGNVDGYVRVHLFVQVDKLIVTVCDNGIGIAPQHHKHVFERFFRVDSARTSRATPSTGIGLDMVRQIVHRHDGTISLDSMLNRGSTFTVMLPVCAT
ncbi:MAG: HAMP domain-containing sensor histidine kinase [Chloroflexota bacterium]